MKRVNLNVTIVMGMLCILTACGSQGGSSSDGSHKGYGSITFTLSWPEGTDTQPATPCETNDINSIWTEVYTANDELLADTQFACDESEFIQTQIPVGTALKIIIKAVNQENQVLYQGLAQGFDILAGKQMGLGTISMVSDFNGNWELTESFSDCVSGREQETRYAIEIRQNGDTATLSINQQAPLRCQLEEIELHCNGSVQLGNGSTRDYASYELWHNGTNLEGNAFWTDSGDDGQTCTDTSVLWFDTVSPPSSDPADNESSSPLTVNNQFGMQFVLVPAGNFSMGSPIDEPGRDDDEITHPVRLSEDFYLQTTEVTQSQWEDVVLAAEDRGILESNLLSPTPSRFDDCGDACPVESISWEDAQLFIRALNQLEEGTYALPTEAQWEYAARAQSITAFANGGITELECGLDATLDQMGWYCGNSDNAPHPVGLMMPNEYGLYDMHGNVYEWCQDWYGPYPLAAVIDPAGPAEGDRRIYRGGSYNHDARRSRNAYRNHNDPDYSHRHVGLRLKWHP